MLWQRDLWYFADKSSFYVKLEGMKSSSNLVFYWYQLLEFIGIPIANIQGLTKVCSWRIKRSVFHQKCEKIWGYFHKIQATIEKTLCIFRLFTYWELCVHSIITNLRQYYQMRNHLYGNKLRNAVAHMLWFLSNPYFAKLKVMRPVASDSHTLCTVCLSRK